MLEFFRLENLILPANQIKSVTTPPDPKNPNESIVRVAILALTDTFDFDGQAAARVYEELQGFVPAPKPNAPSKIVVTVNGASVNPVSLLLPGEEVSSIVTIDGQAIPTDSIEWADLATNFDEGIGVELRLSTDPQGETRKYILEKASQAYDALDALAPQQQVATA
jgi:hypothetical protein